MSTTKNMPLNSYSSMKKKKRKIRIIFGLENWLWKSKIGIFWLLDLERKLIYQNIFFMEKCYFPLKEAAIWCGSCWKNLEWYLLNRDWNTNSLKNNGIDPIVRQTRYTLGVSGGRWCDKSCPKFTMVCSVRYEVFNDSQEVKSAPIVLKNTCQH